MKRTFLALFLTVFAAASVNAAPRLFSFEEIAESADGIGDVSQFINHSQDDGDCGCSENKDCGCGGKGKTK